MKASVGQQISNLPVAVASGLALGVGDEGCEGLGYDGPFLHRVLVDAGLF